MIPQAGYLLRGAAALALLGAVSGCDRDAADAEGPVRLEGDAVAGECGRDCLIGLLDDYLAAVVAHAPQDAPLSADFRGTENTVDVAPGDGVWDSITGLGELQRRYADVETGQAGYVGLIGEGDGIAIVSLRIRAEGRQISEAEWVIARGDVPLYNPAGFTANPPADTTGPGAPEPGAAPELRELAISAVESYYDGVEAADAAGVIAYPDCYRFENGSWMVGVAPGQAPVEPEEAQPGFNIALTPTPASCVGGFENFRETISRVSGRRYFFDADAGVLWAQAAFERPEGSVGRTGEPLELVYLTNIFRIEDGQIRGIHAVASRLGADELGAGWPDQD